MKVELITITESAEKVIEQAARTCYQSGLKAGPGTEKELIAKVIRNGHHSVLEHGYATFRLRGVSRALTHQLVRHRLCSYSQQSRRFVNEANFNFIEPPSIARNPEAHRIFKKSMGEARRVYVELREPAIKGEDARFVLPSSVCGEIVVSADFRELRHILCLRCSPGAQWEIRSAAIEMLRILKEKAPSVFADFVIDHQAGTAHRPFPS